MTTSEALIRLSRAPLEGGIEVPSMKKVLIRWGDMSDTIHNQALYPFWVRFENAQGESMIPNSGQVTILEEA